MMNLDPSTAPPETETVPPAVAPVYLDRSGEAIAPVGCLEADSEAAWSRLALENQPLLIRGRAAEKAVLFYRGRGRSCLELQSPRMELESLGIANEGLAWIEAQWGPDFGARFSRLPQPLRPATLLAALFPSGDVNWSGSPSRSHAARWLLWRAEAASDAVSGLVNGQAALWQGQAAPDIAPLYTPIDTKGAQKLLRIWLGMDAIEGDSLLSAGVFPLAVPAFWLQTARSEWMADLAGRGVAVWNELRTRALLSDALRREAATATAKFLNHHSQHLTPALLAELSEYLAPETFAMLQDLVPPAQPPDLSADASAAQALRWFHEFYWPFRCWQARLPAPVAGQNAAPSFLDHREVSRAAARDFGKWYLNFYARALSGGAGIEFLAGSRARALREPGDSITTATDVTLFVIVDGLHEGDATVLLGHLKARSERLEVLEKGRAFTVLPTITEIAKPALWWGLPPRVAVPLTAGLGRFDAASDGAERAGTRAFAYPDSLLSGRELKEHADVRVLGQAQEGEFWVWNVLALDTAYHRNYPPATTLQEAGQVLESVATKIAAAVEAIPSHLTLRIVISADHGRLPGPSQRCHPAPPGCQTHGRAALVTQAAAAPALDFTEQDYIWEADANGERVWLNPRRFGLAAPAVVCADENGFTLSSGAHSEHFSHGGLWPEELVVPWLVLARDQGVPHIEAEVSGKAKAGAVGTLKVEARNGGEMSLILQEVRLVLGPRDERKLGVSASLPPLGSLTQELALARWPDSAAAARATAVLVLSRPDGSRFEVVARANLESEELYRPSNILEDFDF